MRLHLNTQTSITVQSHPGVYYTLYAIHIMMFLLKTCMKMDMDVICMRICFLKTFTHGICRLQTNPLGNSFILSFASTCRCRYRCAYFLLRILFITNAFVCVVHLEPTFARVFRYYPNNAWKVSIHLSLCAKLRAEISRESDWSHESRQTNCHMKTAV